MRTLSYLYCPLWALSVLLLISLAPPFECIDLLSILGGGRKKKEESLQPVTDEKAKDYLQQFGYVGPAAAIRPGGGLAADFGDVKQTFKAAVRKFQEFAGLNPTGELDIRTKKKMAEPRCGVFDVQAITSGREAAFKWRKNRLTYSILSFSSDLPRSNINKAIRKAFDTWSAVTPLEFVEVPSHDDSADIKIKFASGSHGDPWPFDGRGGVLAHATMPTSGMLHFDEDENWVFMEPEKIASYRYTDLLPVAIHESGHTLGLQHSRVEDAIMAPFYQETVDGSGNYVMPVLKSDDIRAIQDIYGPRRGGSSRGSSSRGSSSRGSSSDRWGSDTDDFGGFGSRGSSRGSSDRDGFGSSGRFGSSDFGGGRSSSFGGSGSRWHGDEDSEWATTERPTTRHRGFFSSLWSKWMGSDSSPRVRARDADPDLDHVNSRGSRSYGECPKTIDAYAQGTNGVGYFFQGSKVYEAKGSLISKTHSLRLLFPNGPVYVEAAFFNEKSQIMLLFQSYNVYAFHYKGGKYELDKDFPKKISGFNPVGGMVWIDGHQFLFSKDDDFAVYDEYWNQANTVNKLSSYFNGFPKAVKGGFTEDGNVVTLFTTSRVYQYDGFRKMPVGESQSISSYLGCQ